MKQELYAFWRYDQFPYCLGAVVTEFKDDLVYAPSFRGYFKPFLVTTKEYGEQLKLKLDILEENRYNELRAVRENYEQELKAIIRIPFKG